MFLPAYRPTDDTRTVASTLGTIAALPDVPQVQVLKPRDSSDAPPNIYSGTFGFDSFPLHTDLAHWYVPPRYFLLRCVVGSPDVTTPIFDGLELVRMIGANRLRGALIQPRRPIAGHRNLLRLLDISRHRVARFRWDEHFNVPATASSRYTCEAVAAALASATTTAIALVIPGDTLIVDNWRMLHGRSPVQKVSINRRVERAYLGALN